MENTANEILDEKRTDVLQLDPRVIQVIDGFNVREDYGDLEGLAQSMLLNGTRNNLRGYKKDGQYYLVSGHRRLRAALMLVEQGNPIRVPFMSEKQKSLEEYLIDTHTTNDGKTLTPLENAVLVKRLVSCEMTVAEIAKRFGCSETYIYNLSLLAETPTKLKHRISNNEISATLVMNMLRNNKTLDIDTLSDTVIKVLDNSQGKKVTKKVLDKATQSINSLADLRTVLKAVNETQVHNKDLYNFAVSIIRNQITADEIKNLLGVGELVES